jgi:hypothetical protein
MDGFKGVNYNALIPFLIESIKTLSEKVSDLQAFTDSLEVIEE